MDILKLLCLIAAFFIIVYIIIVRVPDIDAMVEQRGPFETWTVHLMICGVGGDLLFRIIEKITEL
jgi:hypothetical protein